MIFDMPPSGAQSVRTNRSSFGSINGSEGTPLHSYATVSNGDGYDSDGSNFTPAWVLSFLFELHPNVYNFVCVENEHFINLGC